MNASTASGNVQVTAQPDHRRGHRDRLVQRAVVERDRGAHSRPGGGSAETAPPLITLTVPSSPSGTVTGTGTMDNVQMNDMLGGMTYVNVHSTTYPDGEIRAQVVPVTVGNQAHHCPALPISSARL